MSEGCKPSDTCSGPLTKLIKDQRAGGPTRGPKVPLGTRLKITRWRVAAATPAPAMPPAPGSNDSAGPAPLAGRAGYQHAGFACGACLPGRGGGRCPGDRVSSWPGPAQRPRNSAGPWLPPDSGSPEQRGTLAVALAQCRELKAGWVAGFRCVRGWSAVVRAAGRAGLAGSSAPGRPGPSGTFHPPVRRSAGPPAASGPAHR